MKYRIHITDFFDVGGVHYYGSIILCPGGIVNFCKHEVSR